MRADQAVGAVASPVDAPGITPLSATQAAAWDARTLPTPERVAEDVWAIAVPIPAGTIPNTLCYALLSGEGVHLIDPGWDDPESIAALTSGLAAVGRRLDDVQTVIATHFHPDHMGAVDRVRDLVGARVVFSAIEADVLKQETSASAVDVDAYRETLREWGVPEERWRDLISSFDRPAHVATSGADVAVEDGRMLELSGHRLRVVLTPGHTDGHICLIDEHRRLVYSGDHVLPRIYPGIGIGTLPGSDPLGDYFDSLERLIPYDDFVVLPGHEFRFSGLGARREQIIEHHLRRSAEVAGLLDELGDAPVWEYARRLTWTAGWSGMNGFWLHSALRQTSLHREYVTSDRARERLARRLANES